MTRRRSGKRRHAKASSQPPGAGGAAAKENSLGPPGEVADEPSPAHRPSKPQALSPGLYLVATPIGHARDITLRALDALGQCDAILCEDTRRTAKLLAIHGIRKPLLSYHEHNAATMRPKVLGRLRAGEAIVLVSDAGTPLISDPGYKLVRAALAEGHAVTALPGPSAVLAALSLAALPCERFLFAGFLPSRRGARRKTLRELAAVPATLVFFESPRRLADSLADMAELMPGRAAAVARELTKAFEEVRRGAIEALARAYREAAVPKGEVVVLLGPPVAAAPEAHALDVRLKARLAAEPLKQAVAQLAAETGLSRRTLYARALALKAEAQDKP